MLAATFAIRVNGFYPNPILVFAVWTMRPRMIAAPLWYILASCFSSRQPNPYLWTLKDNILEDALLNIFSLPFAILLIVLRDDIGSGRCSEDSSYLQFWSSFYIIVAAGILSIIILAIMCIHLCTRNWKAQYAPVNSNRQISLFWKWILSLGMLNMVVAFAGQWLLWGSRSIPFLACPLFQFCSYFPSLHSISSHIRPILILENSIYL